MSKKQPKKLRIATESLRKLTPQDLAEVVGGKNDSTSPLLCPIVIKFPNTGSICGYC